MSEPYIAEEEYSLTEAMDFYVADQLSDLIAEADEVLNLCDSADKLTAFLQDTATLSTPGFVLRRQLRDQGLLPPSLAGDPAYANCDENCPWPEKETLETAKTLFQKGRRHGQPVSVKNWVKYLNDDMTQGLQRETIFKLAFVTAMDRKTTARLLLACDQGSYNARNPLELICYYCQYQPGVYTWLDVEELLERFRRGSPEDGAAPAPEEEERTAPMTCWLRDEADRVLHQTLPQAKAEQALLRLMDCHRAEFRGYSDTARARYLAMIRYLYPLYTTYCVVDRRTLQKTVKPVQINGAGTPVLKQQITAACQTRFTGLDDITQTGTGPREVRTAGGQAYSNALGRIALFCKNYYYRANNIDRGKEAVDRRDVLLLGYFLLSGACERGQAGIAALAGLAEAEPVLGQRMLALLPELERLGRVADLQDKCLVVRQILNELLAMFGFDPPLYIPAAFDRFILLCSLKGTGPAAD